jgi:hypothetical protein
LAVLVLFTIEPEDEAEVRSRIVHALRRGRVDGAPRPTAWTVLSERRDDPRPDEAVQARHLGAKR